MEVYIMKNKAILPILLVLIMAIAGGAVYFFVLRDSSTKKEAEPVYFTYNIEDAFVTNVKNSNKLFKITIVLVANTDTLDSILAEKEYIVRDTILFMLRDLTEEDLTKEGIQDELRTKITDALNKALEIDSITTISFGDFVMQ